MRRVVAVPRAFGCCRGLFRFLRGALSDGEAWAGAGGPLPFMSCASAVVEDALRVDGGWPLRHRASVRPFRAAASVRRAVNFQQIDVYAAVPVRAAIVSNECHAGVCQRRLS
jgi:hypothetical protein